MTSTNIINLSDLGEIALSLPAAIIVFLGRELFLSSIIEKIAVESEKSSNSRIRNILLKFDIWAFTLLCFWGISWGGIISAKKKNGILEFIIGQLWFVILMAASVIFLQAKNLNESHYMYFLFIQIIKLSWILHLVNYLPLIPFDMSFFYTREYALDKYIFISKIIISILIVLFPVRNSFITGESFLKFVGIL